MTTEALGSGVPAPPAVAAGEVFALHPRAPALWLGQALAGIVVLGVPAALALVVAGEWLAAAAVPVAGVALAVASGAYGRAYRRRFQCRLLPDGLLIERGVWWRSETFVPRARIQHTELERVELALEHAARPRRGVGRGLERHDLPEVAAPQGLDHQRVAGRPPQRPREHAHRRASRVAQLICASGARR